MVIGEGEALPPVFPEKAGITMGVGATRSSKTILVGGSGQGFYGGTWPEQCGGNQVDNFIVIGRFSM